MDNTYKLTKTFYHVCHLFNTYKITYWIDWGTALGYMRNKSLIPWDYDIDICILDTDYDKMIELFKNEEDNFELICDVDYYDDPGCCALYLKELYTPETRFECIAIDVIKYKIDGESNKRIKSMMTEETILHYTNPKQDLELYNFYYDDVFPLQKVIMSGIITYVPRNNEKITKSYYGEDCKNNYTELSDYIEWRKKVSNPKFMECPFKEIAKFNILEDGLKYYNETKFPFLVKKCEEFEHITTNLVKNNLSQEQNIFSHGDSKYKYKDKEEEYIFKSGKTYIEEWNNNKLESNMVDTPVSDPIFFPKILHDNLCKIKEEKREYAFCYNLTKSNNFTKYHTDPSYGDGWMYLCEGTKLWYIISKEDTEYILNNGYTYEDIEKMKFYDIIQILDGYLWGKIFVGVLSGDDYNFLYWQEGCFHSVITYNKTIGVCGYSYLC
jgi:phosphorylcholine metabolism protein LicD